VREVVYGATRRPAAAFSDRVIDRAAGIVRRSANAGAGMRTAASEVGAELAQVAREVTDPALRRRLSELSARLTDPTGPGVPLPGAATRLSGLPALTPRELDVLAEVARGHGNAQVAVRLRLSEQTVKSYLKTAMAKLGGRTRGEAVYRARAAGLLP
jgi:DNA-binding CsgD family transcriptional regulator